MKKHKVSTGIFIACICSIFLSDIFAQAPDVHLKKIKTEMQSLSAWTGHWQGEGIMHMGPGQSNSSTVNEYIQFKLDSTILLIEGIGTSKDQKTGKEFKTHHALGLLSFNPYTNAFEFKSHLADGKRTDAWFKRIEKDAFQWGFDAPQGKIRYDIIIDPKQNSWKETGEFSQDGNNWHKFFEMSLTKVKQ
jgi:hypothetical protein